jgi:hypothetical protein
MASFLSVLGIAFHKIYEAIFISVLLEKLNKKESNN